MWFWIILILLSTIPMPFALYYVWREYLIKGEGLFSNSTFVSIPLVSLVFAMILIFDREDVANPSEFMLYKRRLNATRKCEECGITSRVYQLSEEDEHKCPQCGGNWTLTEKKYFDNNHYPFAPKIKDFQLIKRLTLKKKLMGIHSDLEGLKEYNKEIEAWEALQRKKAIEEMKKNAEKL